MKPAISVKSPFSHNALFGLVEFMTASSLCVIWTPANSLAGSSPLGLQLCSASAVEAMPERLHHLLERPRGSDYFARWPRNVADSPEDPMDAFSEVPHGS